MSTKKRRNRHHTYGESQKWYFDYNGNKIHRSAGNRNRKHYICDICGSSVPAIGPTPPLCPRCMIPMHQDSSSSNGRRRPAGQAKPKFDYSSRIYYQTDGHPQYIGLPLDHPDPEDEEAVADYLRKKKFNRSHRRHSGNTSSNRRSSWRSRRQRTRQDANPAASPETKHNAEAVADSSGSSRPVPETRAKKQSTESQRKPVPRKQRSKTPTSRSKRTVQPVVSQEEYRGTTLTEDHSAASVLRDTVYQSPEKPPSHRFEATRTGENEAPPQTTAAGETPSEPTRQSPVAPAKKRVSKRSKTRTSKEKIKAPDNQPEETATDDLAGTAL